MRTFTTHQDRIALIVALTAILAQPALKAQTPGNAVVANIPFSFQIGSYSLPPGTYSIRMQGNDLLSIKGEGGGAVMLVMRNSANQPSLDSAVVFHHYGNRYFLREVRTEGDQGVLWSYETRAEHRAKLEEDASNPNSGPREDAKVEIPLLAPPR